jgi:hypothetical protein
MTIMFNHTQRWDDYRQDFPGLHILTSDDYCRAVRILAGPRKADLVIAPDDGSPYLYRWHIYPRNELGFNQYFHIQVADDPSRPLHDHPWDNVSIILAGGYEEHLAFPVDGVLEPTRQYIRKPGDVVSRLAPYAHRLMLPVGVKYTMTMFLTGPKIRDWGFWYPDGWVNHTLVTHTEGNTTIHVERKPAP